MAGARRSLLVSFAERYTALVIGTLGTMLVARMLTPAEIGVFSIGAVLVGLAQVLRDFGVGQYVVATATLGTAQLRAALGVATTAAWSLAAVVALLAGPAAAFYGQPVLRDVLLLLAVNFLLVPLTSLTLSCLRRALRLSAIYLINTTHSVTQLSCTLWLAAAGYGSLSLAWGTVAAAMAAVIVSLPLRPAGMPWLPSWKGAGAVLRFGAYATGGNIVDEAGVAAPELIVGKLLGPEAVAVFGKAQAMLNLFNQAVTSAVSPVLLPLFAAQAREGRSLREPYLLTVGCMTAIAWPFFLLLALLPLSATRLLYGPQWDEAAALIRIMCLAGTLYSMFSMARYLLVATGHVREQARLDTLAVLGRVAVVLPAAAGGLQWVAAAVVLGAIFRSWLTWRCLARLAGVDSQDLLRAAMPSLLVTAVTALAPLSACLFVQPGTNQLLVAVAAAIPLWLAAVALVRHPLAGELGLAWRRIRGRLQIP
ncbi:O-antigen/teichoic acid export membrane protein [Pseudoduganella lurida]|uniref:O-antigen/teichoic acid export membrane protein n=1 Tax=Pseudoduganella lurida TaxID=1036180 RepID=A0A562RK74_9BURK|nr:oligosaccharide flippase family protein [Pseudoduganella lurida]TWI69004.1 O-antigen/teichoic acid export membrane protein [Pseudoduganella lurida]